MAFRIAAKKVGVINQLGVNIKTMEDFKAYLQIIVNTASDKHVAELMASNALAHVITHAKEAKQQNKLSEPNVIEEFEAAYREFLKKLQETEW